MRARAFIQQPPHTTNQPFLELGNSWNLPANIHRPSRNDMSVFVLLDDPARLFDFLKRRIRG